MPCSYVRALPYVQVWIWPASSCSGACALQVTGWPAHVMASGFLGMGTELEEETFGVQWSLSGLSPVWLLGLSKGSRLGAECG